MVQDEEANATAIDRPDRHVRYFLKLGELIGGENTPGDIDFAALDCQSHRVGIRVEAQDDLLGLRLKVPCVVRIGLKDHLLIGFELGNIPGTHSVDRGGWEQVACIGFVCSWIGGRVWSQSQDLREEGNRSGQGKDNGLVIRGSDALYIRNSQSISHIVRALWPNGEQTVQLGGIDRGCQGGAVTKFDAILKSEGIGQTVT